MYGDKALTLRRADRSYRRGLVLGFTVAEIFLLLLFLLLLALASLLADLLSKQDKALKELEAAKSELQALRDPGVAARRNAADELVSKYNLSEQRIRALMLAERELATSKQELEGARKQIETLVRQNERLQQELAVAQEARELVSRYKLSEERIEALLLAESELSARDRELAESRQRIKTLMEQNAQLQQRAAVLQEQVHQLSEKLDEVGKTVEAIAQEKGIDPPCWYDEVTSGGKTRERPIFLFDVAVFDDHLMIRDRPTPERYLAERAGLPLQHVQFMQRLSDSEFREATVPIKKMGKEKKIRSYSCVFYVLVWDQTSTGAKERWKIATETVIGGSFYRETARGEGW